MMRTAFLATLLIVLGSWYFHFGRQMSQKSVAGFYNEQMRMMAAMQAEPLCNTLAEDYRVVDVNFSAAGTQRREADKHAACENLGKSFGNFQQLSHISRGLLAPSFANKIKSITLSEDEKLATVEGTMTVKLGKVLISRTRFTERLVCRNGTIRSLGGESKSWAYGGR